jgi:RNA polymerase sigma-70 factor (ECF subfamily)
VAGEREFSEFVSARMPAVRGWAYLLTGDHARAEDLVQHAFAATYRHWRRISPESAEAYVRRAVLNAHLSWWRRGWSRHEQLFGEVPDRAGADPMVSLEERDEMWAALAELPPRQRAVLVLRYYEDLPEAEIARVLDISPGTVKSQAARALARLRTRYADPAGSDRPAQPMRREQA